MNIGGNVAVVPDVLGEIGGEKGSKGCEDR